MVLTEFLGF